MQKIVFLILALLALTPKLCPEEIEASTPIAAEPAQQETEAPEISTGEGAHPQTGSAAGAAAEASQRGSWQNWVFAGSALVTVTAGVVIISLNSGNTSH